MIDYWMDFHPAFCSFQKLTQSLFWIYNQPIIPYLLSITVMRAISLHLKLWLYLFLLWFVVIVMLITLNDWWYSSFSLITSQPSMCCPFLWKTVLWAVHLYCKLWFSSCGVLLDSPISQFPFCEDFVRFSFWLLVNLLLLVDGSLLLNW